MATQKYGVGVDLGGTKIATALVDGEGRVLARTSCLTEAQEGQEKVLERMYKTVEDVLGEAGIAPGELAGIGIGSPGPLDSKTGLVLSAPNLGWTNVPVGDLFRERFQVPISVGNDANLAGLGEKWLGAGKNVDDLLYITVSTGVGGGIIIGGKVHTGAHDIAGEVGHIIVQKDGPQCNCGARGCLEAIASGTAIAREAKAGLKRGESPLLAKLVGDGDPTSKDVGQAARKGDPFSTKLLQESFTYLGLGIASLLNVLDPQLVVIGGGVSNLDELLFDPVRKTVKETLGTSQLADVLIVKAELGADVGVLGAAMLVVA